MVLTSPLNEDIGEVCSREGPVPEYRLEQPALPRCYDIYIGCVAISAFGKFRAHGQLLFLPSSFFSPLPPPHIGSYFLAQAILPLQEA